MEHTSFLKLSFVKYEKLAPVLQIQELKQYDLVLCTEEGMGRLG